MKYLHHAVNAVDRGGFTQDDTPMMFSTLTDEETIQLASLLENCQMIGWEKHRRNQNIMEEDDGGCC